jgi:diguanylate cyclase (GGDEF)-like protein
MPRMSAVPSVSPPDFPPRVLLLDDDPVGRLLAGRALRERGFDVVEFDRAQEALEAIEGGGFDCAVCDMLMPDVDGIEFCRRVRSSPRGAALPVLMLTSLDDAEATARACEAGATDYVIKSVNWTLLVHRIRQAMHLRRLERGDGREASASGPAGGAPPAGFEWRPAERRLRGSADLFRLLDWADAPATIADRRVLALIAPPDRRMLRRAIATMLDGGPAVRREVEVDTLAARTRRLRVDVRQVTTDVRGALEVAGTVLDVTPAGGRDETIYRLTRYDGLTGLPNRTWLLERLRRPRPAGTHGLPGLAVLDIDRFHHVGEALGQSASERLLVEVAQRLRRLAAAGPRSAGAIDAVVNLRGSEFALLLEGLPDAAAGLAIAHDAVASLHEPFRVDGREVFLRASVGVHAAEPNGDDGAQRLARADLARRAAAGAGGNCALAFEPSMTEPGYDRLETERDLHYALGRGEMSMHYQPQVDATDGRIVGFEALMHWTRGGRLHQAGKFIPLAEETGLIVPLGEWAIDRSCEALAALHARGLHDCVLSVNLSCQQLRTGRLPGVIAAALAAHRLPADRLEVELTESGLMADPEVAVARLKAVRALGAGLAVDDFGTGYSSLAYLTRLPLTTLKIDRSFVQDVHASERSSAVAHAIVALGANLQLRVVAEGVETVAQRDALISLGCNLQQGFLYGRAVPLDEALSLADRRAIAPHRTSLETVS